MAIRVFKRDIVYHDPFQEHGYRFVFDDTAKNGGLAADVNGDGRLELLIADSFPPPPGNLSYTVWTWDEEKQEFRKLRTITDDQVKSLSEKIEL